MKVYATLVRESTLSSLTIEIPTGMQPEELVGYLRHDFPGWTLIATDVVHEGN